MRARRTALAAVALLGVVTLGGCGGHATAAASSQRLIGLFKLTPGQCTTSKARPTGSYLIAISASQSKAARNPKAGCADADYTPLVPGTDGGLITGQFQGQPSPTFDAHRNSLATRIVKPTSFGPFRFGFATSARDEQDAPAGEPAFPAPVAIATGSTLNIDLRSLVVTYAGQPGSNCAKSYGLGCWELGSKSASGTYDATTHRFVIDWFAGESFTPKADSMEVHLEGTFVPRSST
jgi:hypothetical protein